MTEEDALQTVAEGKGERRGRRRNKKQETGQRIEHFIAITKTLCAQSDKGYRICNIIIHLGEMHNSFSFSYMAYVLAMYLACARRGVLCPATDLLTDPRDARGVTADARPDGVSTAILVQGPTTPLKWRVEGCSFILLQVSEQGAAM